MSSTNQKPEALVSLLSRINANPQAKRLFKALWENEHYARLFFAHTENFFKTYHEDGIEFVFPFLFFDTLPEDLNQNEAARHLFKSEAELRTEKAGSISDPIGKKFEQLSGDWKAFLCLSALRFIKSNPGMAELLKGDFSFASIKQAITNTPPSFAIFDEVKQLGKLLKGAEAEGPGDKVLMNLLAKESEGFRKLTKSGFGALFKVQDHLMFPSIHAESHEHLASLLKNQRLARGSYENILAELYSSKLISNLTTAFWCVGCQDDPFLFTTTSRISPRHLRLICPKCAREVSASAVYGLDPLLYDAIHWKDGLLGAAIAWLLEKKAISYSAGIYSGADETDFVLHLDKGQALLECKVYKTGKDSDSVSNNLRKIVQQIIKHAESIRASGSQLLAAFAVVNYELASYPGEVESVASTYREDIQKYGIKLVDAFGFPKALSDLASFSKSA